MAPNRPARFPSDDAYRAALSPCELPVLVGSGTDYWLWNLVSVPWFATQGRGGWGWGPVPVADPDGYGRVMIRHSYYAQFARRWGL